MVKSHTRKRSNKRRASRRYKQQGGNNNVLTVGQLRNALIGIRDNMPVAVGGSDAISAEVNNDDGEVFLITSAA